MYAPEQPQTLRENVRRPWARRIQISGKFGLKLNESVWSNRKSFEKTGPPFEVDHFFRSDRSKFWLNGSRPLIGTTIENRGTRREYRSKPLKHSIVERISEFKR